MWETEQIRSPTTKNNRIGANSVIVFSRLGQRCLTDACFSSSNPDVDREQTSSSLLTVNAGLYRIWSIYSARERSLLSKSTERAIILVARRKPTVSHGLHLLPASTEYPCGEYSQHLFGWIERESAASNVSIRT